MNHHLSADQIKECASKSPGGCPDEIETHLAGCGFCLDRLLQWQRTHLKNLESNGMRPEPYQDCPPDSILQEVAAEIVAPETAAQILQHAAQCDHCGPLLNRYLQEFSEELSPEIEAIIEQLPISQPSWQRMKAREIIRGFPDPDQDPSFIQQIRACLVQHRAWAAATAAVAVATIASLVWGPVLIAEHKLQNEKQQVAAAYAEQRTTEMRFTSVDYGPLRRPVRTLGTKKESEDLDRPAFFKAWSGLADRLQSDRKPDPRWLQIQGRLVLLKDPAKAAEAEEAFRQAQSKGLNDPSLEIDLAASFFEHDMIPEPKAPGIHGLIPPQEKSPNLSRSINLLTKVLDNPKLSTDQRSVALFDLAIAYEKSNMWDLAVPIWDKYLETDSTGPWSDEARSRREKAKEHLHDLKGQGCAEFRDPSLFLVHLSDNVVQQNAEECLEIGLISWLPEAVQAPDSASARAAYQLAAVFEKQHSDPWFNDFLKQLRPRPDDLEAVTALSSALQANQDGRVTVALEKAEKASSLFAKHGNVPGKRLAGFEKIYAYQRNQDGDHCRSEADRLDPMLEHTSYRWLQAQIALERAVCLSKAGDLSEFKIEASLKKSLDLAKGFPILTFRILGIAPGIRRQLGPRCGKSWPEEVRGLGDFWGGIYPAERLFQFYSVLAQCAEQEGYWNAAEPLLRRAIAIREQIIEPDHQDPFIMGALYLHLASILTVLQKDISAESAARHAESIFDSAPDGPTKNQFRLSAKITLAECQSSLGKAELALETLRPGPSLLPETTDTFILLDFRRVKGKVLQQLGRLDEAEPEYKSGIEIAEDALSTLKDADSRLRWAAKTAEMYRGLAQIWLAQNRVDDAWRLWEWSKTRSLLDSQNKNPEMAATSWGELQKTILAIEIPQGRELHVVYASFKDRLHVWVVSRGRIRSKWIELKRRDLESLSADFGNQCADRDSLLEDLHKQGEKLFSSLIQPVLPELSESQTVAFELDQPLQKTPLQALRSPEGWYLVERYSIAYSPGMLIEEMLRKPRAFGESDSHLLINALPAQAIRHPFFTRTLFRGAVTSVPEVLRALAKSDTFYFFGHGERNGTGTALMLSPASSVTSEDLSRQKLPRLRLAVLAACSTGAAGEYGLLDTNNLVHVLLAQGVPSVVASQWDVDPDSTVGLMDNFFYNLLDREPVPSAINNAQRAFLRDANLEHRHPYYWAGFSLAGRSN